MYFLTSLYVCLLLFMVLRSQAAQRAVPKHTTLERFTGLKGNTYINVWHAAMHMDLLCCMLIKQKGLDVHHQMLKAVNMSGCLTFLVSKINAHLQWNCKFITFTSVHRSVLSSYYTLTASSSSLTAYTMDMKLWWCATLLSRYRIAGKHTDTQSSQSSGTW